MPNLRPITSVLLVAALMTAAFLRASVYHDEVSLYTDAVAKSAGKARPHNNLGHALKAAGRFAEAGMQFERALEIQPDYPDALNNLSTLYQSQGRPDEALTLLRRALALEPGHVPSRFNLAMAFYESGLHADAAREYGIIITLAPLSKEAAFARKMLAVIGRGR